MGNVRKATILMMGFAVIAKVTGFIRETTFAAVYGISEEMDAFLLASIVPVFLTGIIQRGLVSAFIPIYNDDGSFDMMTGYGID